MFTVLIQNQKTLDSFYEHLPLFNEYVEGGQMSVCLWNEAGMTVEEALPDLHELTDHKERWRAILVRYEDDAPMAGWPHEDDNPYDFPSAHSQNGLSQVPLVRLCQLLSRPLEYVNQANDPHVDENAIPAFDGVYPDSILLVSVRSTDSLQRISRGCISLEHGDFVDINGYPGSCRFTVVDRIHQGPGRKMEDDFDFWSLVLLMARSAVDSSLMRAYRLHALSLTKDRKRMEQVWAKKGVELNDASARIAHLLANQSVRFEKMEGKYPDYMTRIELPRSLEEPESRLDPRPFLHAPGKDDDQVEEWQETAEKMKQDLLETFDHVPEDVSRALPALHLRSGYEEDEVDPLNPLQMERLGQEIQDLKLKIIEEMGALPDISILEDEELEKQAKEITLLLKERMRRGQIIGWGIGLTSMDTAVVAGSWIAAIKGLRDGLPGVILFSLILMGLPPGLIAWEAHTHKKKVHKALRKYQTILEALYGRIKEYRLQYADYLSDTLSYRRAQSYYELSVKKTASLKDRQRELENLQKRLLDWQAGLKKWSQAMRLSMVLEDDDLDIYRKIEELPVSHMEAEDLMSPNIETHLFTLEPDGQGQCEIEDLGRSIASPFSFLKSLAITTLIGRDETC